MLDQVLRSCLWWQGGGGGRGVCGGAALTQTGAHCPPARRGAATSAAPCWREEPQCREVSVPSPREGMSELPQHNSPVQLLLPEKLGSSTSKDELQGSLNVPSSGLQGSEAQLVIVDAHVSQLLKLWLPLALQAGLPRGLQSML